MFAVVTTVMFGHFQRLPWTAAFQ